MRFLLSGAGLLALGAAQASGGTDPRAGASGAEPGPAPLSWSAWSQSLAAASPATAAAHPPVATAAADLDVVDAHWMALTMWGEARGSGEEAMRAVGHVIDNRRRAGGRYVTDTVSEAYQFSCWNAGDPNLRAMQSIDDLSHSGEAWRMWQSARRIADEILSGRSQDPTGGALFYHATYVAPRWSRGVPPVARIGGHLFFLTAH
jgi:spore germination cell wall hydrolase CwlJ-like protein